MHLAVTPRHIEMLEIFTDNPEREKKNEKKKNYAIHMNGHVSGGYHMSRCTYMVHVPIYKWAQLIYPKWRRASDIVIGIGDVVDPKCFV
jgi:hypothetical protein